MASVEKVLAKANAVDPGVRFTEDAAHWLSMIPFFARGGEIPVAFLGMGADGHTCSLFTREDLDRGAGRLASPTPRPTPPHRVTVTPALLERCDHVIKIPTSFCVNVAVAGAIVMYDRLITLGKFAERPLSPLGQAAAGPANPGGRQPKRNL